MSPAELHPAENCQCISIVLCTRVSRCGFLKSLHQKLSAVKAEGVIASTKESNKGHRHFLLATASGDGLHLRRRSLGQLPFWVAARLANGSFAQQRCNSAPDGCVQRLGRWKTCSRVIAETNFLDALLGLGGCRPAPDWDAGLAAEVGRVAGVRGGDEPERAAWTWRGWRRLVELRSPRCVLQAPIQGRG